MVMSPHEVCRIAVYSVSFAKTSLGDGAWSNCGLGVEAAGGTLAPHATVLAGLACAVTVPVCFGAFFALGEDVADGVALEPAVVLDPLRCNKATPRAMIRMPAIAPPTLSAIVRRRAARSRSRRRRSAPLARWRCRDLLGMAPQATGPRGRHRRGPTGCRSPKPGRALSRSVASCRRG